MCIIIFTELKKKTSFAVLKISSFAFRSRAAQKGTLSNKFTLNLPSVLSHVLLVHLLGKVGKDIGYWWDWAFFGGTIQISRVIRSENRPTGLEFQFKAETFVKLKKLIWGYSVSDVGRWLVLGVGGRHKARLGGDAVFPVFCASSV